MSTGNVAMISENQAGKTEPAFQATVWGFSLANYAWIHHFIHHLSPVGGAGFVLANGSMPTQTSNKGEIRKALIVADLVDFAAKARETSHQNFSFEGRTS